MVNRGAVREYVNGSLWVWPGISGMTALLVGFAVSEIDVAPGSPLAPLAFQGTADDARALLTIIAGTVVTVIALVLGLTVVALQLSSTQFSPRLLRKFLRDRANQVEDSCRATTVGPGPTRSPSPRCRRWSSTTPGHRPPFLERQGQTTANRATSISSTPRSRTGKASRRQLICASHTHKDPFIL